MRIPDVKNTGPLAYLVQAVNTVHYQHDAESGRISKTHFLPTPDYYDETGRISRKHVLPTPGSDFHRFASAYTWARSHKQKNFLPTPGYAFHRFAHIKEIYNLKTYFF